MKKIGKLLNQVYINITPAETSMMTSKDAHLSSISQQNANRYQQAGSVYEIHE